MMEPVELMGRADLEHEVERLRAAILKVVKQRGDDVCWRDAYTDLAKLVGIDYVPELILDPAHMLDNCCAFIKSLYGGEYVPVHVERNEKHGKAKKD